MYHGAELKLPSIPARSHRRGCDLAQLGCIANRQAPALYLGAPPDADALIMRTVWTRLRSTSHLFSDCSPQLAMSG